MLQTSLSEVDWSFPELSNTGLHSFHWYPATYLAAIPGTLIPEISSPNELILDPFCGSGTSGLEAVRLGRRFIGLDTNPIALLITRAKLSFPSVALMHKELELIVEDVRSVRANNAARPIHANERELLDWYHPQTYNELNDLLTAILRIRSEQARFCFIAIFSSILKNTSSQGKHWGWVCDNVKPKIGELTYKDAISIFIATTLQFSRDSDAAFRAARVHTPGLDRTSARAMHSLFQGSCTAWLATAKQSSIDAVVTSPPYYGVADYVKSQRLSYLWFDKDELDASQLGFRNFEKLRALEAGARSNRHRRSSHLDYLEFMEEFFAGCAQVLKPRSAMVLVVGESGARKATTDTLISLAQGKRFELKSRGVRDIRPTRRRLMAKVKGEDILTFKLAK